jgi:hypothetical protein
MAVTKKPAQFPLRLPNELHADIQELAEDQGVSMNQFLLYVVASKVSEMKQSREFISRRRGGRSRKQSADGLRKILDKVSGENPVLEGDELPKPE